MYLSLLKLNPRSRKAMTEAARPHELHRTIMRAFPSKDNGGPGRVLFRLDIDHETGDMSVLVQSEKEPDWAALANADGFLLQEPKYKMFQPAISRGQVLYFRLRANPTVKRNDRRLGVLRDKEQMVWLERKANEGGFRIVSNTTIPEGVARDKKTDNQGKQHDLSLLSVRFEGLLHVTEPRTFAQTLEHGIGSGKGLGFGLLSVAPLKGA